jgi:hypothetical protein
MSEPPRYFLQLACALLSGLSFGLFMGRGLTVFLRLWSWHKTTRITHSGRADEPQTRKK